MLAEGELITMFLNEDLIDELQVCHIPIILGAGIPLFPNNPKESNWELIRNTVYDSGIIKIDYQIKRL